jgi:hypothetical protein
MLTIHVCHSNLNVPCISSNDKRDFPRVCKDSFSNAVLSNIFRSKIFTKRKISSVSYRSVVCSTRSVCLPCGIPGTLFRPQERRWSCNCFWRCRYIVVEACEQDCREIHKMRKHDVTEIYKSRTAESKAHWESFMRYAHV